MRSYLHNLPKAFMLCGNNKIFQVGFSLVLGSLERKNLKACSQSQWLKPPQRDRRANQYGYFKRCVSVWHSVSVNFTKEISLKFIQILRVGLHSNLRGLYFLSFFDFPGCLFKLSFILINVSYIFKLSVYSWDYNANVS